MLDLLQATDGCDHEWGVRRCHLNQGTKLQRNVPSLDLDDYSSSHSGLGHFDCLRALALRDIALPVHLEVDRPLEVTTLVLPRLHTRIDQLDLVGLAVEVVLAGV